MMIYVLAPTLRVAKEASRKIQAEFFSGTDATVLNIRTVADPAQLRGVSVRTGDMAYYCPGWGDDPQMIETWRLCLRTDSFWARHG